MSENITIALTQQEYFALISILVDLRLRRDSTAEWVDVLRDRTVTIDDLLSKVMRERARNHTPGAPEETR